MSDLPKLTARQQQILELIQSAIANTGSPPTRAEIATELGFKSANAAEEHLQALARKGAIELVSGTSRGIRLKSHNRAQSAAGGEPYPHRTLCTKHAVPEHHIQRHRHHPPLSEHRHH